MVVLSTALRANTALGPKNGYKDARHKQKSMQTSLVLGQVVNLPLVRYANIRVDPRIILLQRFGCFRGSDPGVPNLDLAFGSTTIYR